MEEDVEPKDEDGVDGRGVCGWDGWVCGLGVVTPQCFRLLFSRILVEQYRRNDHFLRTMSSS
jgi:hypothetical protein